MSAKNVFHIVAATALIDLQEKIEKAEDELRKQQDLKLINVSISTRSFPSCRTVS
jgi:hypothetical protein